MPAVSRQGDQVLSVDGTGRNCAQPMRTSVAEVNSKKVYANGTLIVVEGNTIAPHQKNGCSLDESKLTSYSSKVRIGGKGVGRVGDKYDSPGTSNTITQGSSNVFAGG
jgi:uncharacterized Zn-binding protein involved in type VI secretion